MTPARRARNGGGLRAWLRVGALATALIAASSISGARAAPADVPASWRADGRTLELAPLPDGFVRSRRGPLLFAHPRGTDALVDALWQRFQAEWPRIGAELGRELDPAMTIAIARDPEELRRVAPPGHLPPRYAVGVAYPASGLVLLTMEGNAIGSRPDLPTVFVHELSHVALQRAVEGHEVPRWFSEGLAIHQAREQTLTRMQTLLDASMEGSLVPLARLDRAFSGRAFEVNVAYAQSADLVAFLARADESGRKLRRLITGLRRGATFERALEESHYLTPIGLEREWRDDLRERYGSLPFVFGGSALWLVATVLLLLAWRKRRNEKRRRLRRMEQEEIALDRLEALLAAKLDEGAAGGAVQAEDDLEGALGEAPPPRGDADVPTIVHRGRSHTLH